MKNKKIVFKELDYSDLAELYFTDLQYCEGADAIVCGNRDYKEYNFAGKSIKIDELIQDYNRGWINMDEFIDGLKEATGKDYDYYEMRGCCQRDWQYLFYVKGTMDTEHLELYSDYYMGCYKEYYCEAEDCSFVVCDSELYPKTTKQVLAEQSGYKPEEIIVYEISGYTKTPNYTEAD